MKLLTNNDVPKIIILSFQRNATQSTFDFLIKNSFPGIHHLSNIRHSGEFLGWGLEQIQDYTKAFEDDFVHFSDAPYFMMYEYFDKRYANAKFILIERNSDDWLKSFRKLYNFTPLDPISRACFTKYLPEIEILDIEIKDISDEKLLYMYNKHNSKIKQYFKNKKNLLVLDIAESKKEDKLMKFLDLDLQGDFQNHDYVPRNVSTF
jgi:hypothetical protein